MEFVSRRVSTICEAKSGADNETEMSRSVIVKKRALLESTLEASCSLTNGRVVF